MRNEEVEKGGIGTCENCKRSGVEVRRVEAIGMFREKRGFWNICFECEPRKIFWTAGDGRRMETPIRKGGCSAK